MRMFWPLAVAFVAGCTENSGVSAAATLQPQPPGSCQASPPEALSWTPEQRRRHRLLWSDSLWLISDVRKVHRDRLAGVRLEVGQAAADARLVFRLTGHKPIPPMRLGGHARGLPVVVEYGAQYNLSEVEAIRARAHDRVLALLPTLQGVGYDEGVGAIQLDVHAADEQARLGVLRHCKALAKLYGMPVRISPNKGVVGF